MCKCPVALTLNKNKLFSVLYTLLVLSARSPRTRSALDGGGGDFTEIRIMLYLMMWWTYLAKPCSLRLANPVCYLCTARRTVGCCSYCTVNLLNLYESVQPLWDFSSPTPNLVTLCILFGISSVHISLRRLSICPRLLLLSVNCPLRYLFDTECRRSHLIV
jgi:hypothetical protein